MNPQSTLRDLRYSLRALRRSPGFAAAVILILALGIGANSAIFSVIDAVILRRLPYPSPERLVMLPASHRPDDMGAEVSMANFLDWRRESRSFAGLGAFGPLSLNLTGAGSPEQLQASQISPAALAALGMRPLLGRLFLPEEERDDSRIAILSYGFWRSHLAGDPSVLSRTIRLSGAEYPIVGVMPPRFRFPSEDVQLWVPLRITERRAADRQSRWLYVVGRLKDGVSPAAARHEMDGLTGALARQYPRDNKDWGVRLVPLHEHLVGRVRPALLILLATVLLVLVIACANIANLQLARAAARHRELSIRSAMGASAWDVLRQLLVEGTVLALLGGLFGLLLAHASLRLLVAWSSRYIPRLDEVGIDGRTLIFTLGISVLVGVIFGLVPARSAFRSDLARGLREGGRSASAGGLPVRLRRLLAGAEIAAALVLLIGAGLLLSSLARLQRVEPGFHSDGVLTMAVVLPAARYPDDARRSAFFRQLVARASRLPGVTAAAGVANLPFSGSNATDGYEPEGRPSADPNDRPEAGERTVTPGYFRALQIPLLRGRDFSERDTAASAPVVVVNKTLAGRCWPGEDPIGKGIFLGGSRKTRYEVIGVVGDIRHTRLDLPAVAEIYLSYEQYPGDTMVLLARSTADPADLGARLRREVASLDPEQPVFNLRTMARVVAESTSEPRLYTTLLGVFAGLALTLSVLGVYSILSYSVAQRRHEFAVRVALGAQRRDVLRLVVGEGMRVAAGGILAGLVTAGIATRGLASLLFAVRPDDPTIFAATAGLLGGVALVACLLPALRAARTSPMAALRA